MQAVIIGSGEQAGAGGASRIANARLIFPGADPPSEPVLLPAHPETPSTSELMGTMELSHPLCFPSDRLRGTRHQSAEGQKPREKILLEGMVCVRTQE